MPFHIYTDASDYAYGAVLLQEHENELCPIAWAGRRLTKSEQNYYVLEKELGAIVFAHIQWRCYLENGHPVIIHSDHNPLQFLRTQKKLSGKHARWLESLSKIDWRITYIPGDKNVVADAVSRAIHHKPTELVLHDGATIAADKTIEPYQAFSLASDIVRRSTLDPRAACPASSPDASTGTRGTRHQSTAPSPSKWTPTAGSSESLPQMVTPQALFSSQPTAASAPAIASPQSPHSSNPRACSPPPGLTQQPPEAASEQNAQPPPAVDNWAEDFPELSRDRPRTQNSSYLHPRLCQHQSHPHQSPEPHQHRAHPHQSPEPPQQPQRAPSPPWTSQRMLEILPPPPPGPIPSSAIRTTLL